MGSFDAFKWAKDARVGDHAAKLVLIMMADKVNERFELYPSNKQLAVDCEMSKPTLNKHQQSLLTGGWITVIERVRCNGAQARSTVLLNHPDAPHMSGEPVTLDFQGRHLYPKHPETLRAYGVQWIAGGEVGATHSSGETAGQQGGKTFYPPGGKHSPPGGKTSYPPGGKNLGPLISNPQNSPTQPTTSSANAESMAVPADSSHNDGWLVGDSSADEVGETRLASSASNATGGAALLRRVSDQAKAGLSTKAIRTHAPAVDAALERGVTTQQLTTQLGDGLTTAKNPAGALVSRLRELATEQQDRANEQQAQRSAAHHQRAAKAQANTEHRAQAGQRASSPEHAATFAAEIKADLARRQRAA